MKKQMNDSNDLRLILAALTQSHHFARLRIHTQKILAEFGVMNKFPSTREDFFSLISWLESKVPFPMSIDLLCSFCANHPDETVRAVFVALALPACLSFANNDSKQFHRMVLSSTPATVHSASCSIVFHPERSLVDIVDFLAEAPGILRSISYGTLPPIPVRMYPSAVPKPCLWNGFSWGDIVHILQMGVYASDLGISMASVEHRRTIQASELDESLQQFILLQNNAYNAYQKQFHTSICGVLPRESFSIKPILDTFSEFKPWAGPFERHSSFWKRGDIIVSYQDMIRTVFEDVNLHDLRIFERVNVAVPVKTSMSRTVHSFSVVSQAMIGNDVSLPKTFSFLPPNQTFPPWKVSNLTELKDISDQECRGILFQIVWTFAALQREFPGFHVKCTNIRLVSFPKARCFRVGGMRGKYTFVIPVSIPLPIVVESIQHDLEEKSDLEKTSDLEEVLDIFKSLGTFASIQEIKTLPPQELLFSELFDDFLSKASSTSAVAHIESF